MTKPPIELKPNIDELDIAQPHIVEPYEVVIVNTVNYFFTFEKYKVQDNLINWCRAEAAKAGFTIVIKKSNIGSGQRKPFFILGCERGGVYKERKNNLKIEDTTTRKCKCSFRLRGYFLA
jgi:hypothetical protein